LSNSTAPTIVGERLPITTKIAFGLGSGSVGAKTQVLALLLLYYNQVIGLPAQWVSGALGIAIFVDALWDPIVGQFSDNLRTRWGRRHPLMYAAMIPVGIGAVLLWNPPAGLSDGMLFLYLLSMIVLVRLASSLFEVPNTALAPELAPDYHERTVVLSYRWLFQTLIGALAAIMAYFVFLRPTPQYKMGQLNPDAYLPLSIATAALMVGCMLVSALGTHGRIKDLHQPPQRKLGLGQMFAEVYATLNNRNFIVAITAGLLAGIAFGLTGGLATYFSTYFWELPARNIGVLVLTGLIAAPLAFVIAPRLSRRYGKRNACVTLFFLSVLTNNAPILLRLLHFFPSNDSPWLLPILTLDRMVTNILGLAGFMIVTSMIADIVEDSQVKTGRRSEGLLFAADTLLQKVVTAVGTALSGVLIAFVGFPAKATPGAVSEEVMHHLAWIYMPVTAGLSLLSIATWFFYRIDKAKHDANLAAVRDAALAAGRDDGTVVAGAAE
jgi:Na+/melibiose symporter-like transporter